MRTIVKLFLVFATTQVAILANEYNPKEVICSHYLNKTIQIGQELQQSIVDGDTERTDGCISVLRDYSELIKRECKKS